MKNVVYIIVIFVITFLYLRLLDYLGVSYLISILTAFPILFYVFIYATVRYNFRKSLSLEPIPEKGYDLRLSKLEKNSNLYLGFGFTKFDDFYLPIANDVIAYVYYHKELSIVLCDYHLGQKNYCDLVSKFENNFTLTTNNMADSGLIPRKNENMLQIFPERTFEELFKEHQKATEFLHQRNFTLVPFQTKSFRIWFLRDYQKVGESLKKLISPILMFYWKISQNKKRYMKSVQEQFLSKTLQIPTHN